MSINQTPAPDENDKRGQFIVTVTTEYVIDSAEQEGINSPEDAVEAVKSMIDTGDLSADSFEFTVTSAVS